MRDAVQPTPKTTQPSIQAHRRALAWQIALPMLVGMAVVVALAVIIARASANTVAHAAALVVMCLAGGLVVLGLPVLALLVWLALRWPRAYAALPRYTARLRQQLTAWQQQAERAADAAAHAVMAPRVRYAQARALWRRVWRWTKDKRAS